MVPLHWFAHGATPARRAGHDVVVADNFSTGFRDALTAAGSPALAELDIADVASLNELFAAHRFDAVLHFASFIQVGPSERSL